MPHASLPPLAIIPLPLVLEPPSRAESILTPLLPRLGRFRADALIFARSVIVYRLPDAAAH